MNWSCEIYTFGLSSLTQMTKTQVLSTSTLPLFGLIQWGSVQSNVGGTWHFWWRDMTVSILKTAHIKKRHSYPKQKLHKTKKCIEIKNLPLTIGFFYVCFFKNSLWFIKLKICWPNLGPESACKSVCAS